MTHGAYAMLADAVLAVHVAFVLFAALGGFAALRWPIVAWAHVPAALWGAFIELSGSVCPLTPLENDLRLRAGEAAYAGDFIGRYLLVLLYPEGLTRDVQLMLGAAVIIGNAVVYAALLRRLFCANRDRV